MPGRAEAPLRVLIVDDNRDTAESLAMVVRLWGHEVRTPHDGLSAVELSLAFLPEAVVLDIGLPGIDGFEVAARLRALPEFEGTLIVGSSGYNRESDRLRATEVGIDLYLTKPFDPWGLEAILCSHRARRDAVPASSSAAG